MRVAYECKGAFGDSSPQGEKLLITARYEELIIQVLRVELRGCLGKARLAAVFAVSHNYLISKKFSEIPNEKQLMLRESVG